MDLERAGTELAATIAAQMPAECKPPPARHVISLPQLETITGASDLTTMRAVVTALREHETDPEHRAALETLRNLVASVWPDP